MADEMMQAIRVHRYGEPEQLQLELVPRLVPKEGEVLVKIHATGVLPIEWKIRSGAFRNYMPAAFPYTPGSAFAGIVELVGPDVTTFQKGQAVFGRTNNGAYAEYTTVTTETLAL